MIRRSARRLLLLLTVVAGVTAAGSGPGPAAAAARRTVDVPDAIDSTGGTDVTAVLNTFLATIPVGATVRFAPGGRYLVDGVLFLPGRQDVTLDGRGATLLAPTDGAAANPPQRNFAARWPRSREHLEIVDSHGVTIRDLTIRGPNPSGAYRAALEAQAGIVVKRSEGVTLDRVTIADTYGDGVYVIGASSGVHLRDCTLDHNGRQGVAVVAGDDITVERCTIRAPGRSALDLEPGFGPASNVHFTDNEILDAGNLFVAAVGGGNGVHDVWIERNRVQGGKGLTIIAGTGRFVRTGFHVIDNTAEGTSNGYQDTLMSFTRYDGVEVRGNRQTVGSGVVPVRFTDSCRTAVTDNQFGGGAAAPESTGDCTAPGLAPPRPTPTTRPPGTRTGGGTGATGNARRNARRAAPRPTTPPSTVVVTRTEDGSGSAVAIVIAFAAGVAAGAGGVVLARRTRRTRRTDRTAPGAGDGDPTAGEDGPAAPEEGEGR